MDSCSALDNVLEKHHNKSILIITDQGVMGIPQKLSGIRKEDIPIMAQYAEKEANPLYPVPKLMTRKELERFYYLVADWSVE